jgi:hypothetical protein
MNNTKSTSLYILLFIAIFLIHASYTYAHSGRTDASGCHTNHSTGVYHCHNGSGSSSNSNSSSTNYQYKDNDHNGVNDYNQDRGELAENLKSIGVTDGYNDAELGSFKPDAAYDDLSNEEYSWYKLGYEEGYNRKLLQILQEEAREEGYQSGLSMGEKVIPTKYLISKEIQNSYDNGFLEGQKEKWVKIAEDAASSFKSLSFPEHLPQTVKESAQNRYDLRFESVKKTAYKDGYTSAFKNETFIPSKKYEHAPIMKEQFKRGFHENSEITTYMKQAYEKGKQGEKYLVPIEVTENQAEGLYRKHFEIGENERKQIIYKWVRIGSIGLAIVSIAFIYFYRKRKKIM